MSCCQIFKINPFDFFISNFGFWLAAIGIRIVAFLTVLVLDGLRLCNFALNFYVTVVFAIANANQRQDDDKACTKKPPDPSCDGGWTWASSIF